MIPLRETLACLRAASRGRRWLEVAEVGRIREYRTRQGKRRWYVDLRPYGRIYSVPGSGALESHRDAMRVLLHVQGELGKGKRLEEILDTYLPPTAKLMLIDDRLDTWLDDKRRAVDSGDRSPTYLRELERYARPGGYIGWWRGRSIVEIYAASVDDWYRWLQEQPIAGKTRRNVIEAFRSFLGWLRRRDEIERIPDMPVVPVDEHAPRIISMQTQDAILRAIPEEERGIFLAMARLGLRPGEARALDTLDYEAGWLTVSKACKGITQSAPIRSTKTRRVRRIPVDDELRAWIEARLGPQGPLRVVEPLFRNPRARAADRRWSWRCLDRVWRRACMAVGVEIGLYEGTKHAMATDALRRGVQERTIQAFLGHADLRSTRRYARLADQALETVLRPRQTSDRQGPDEPST